MQHVPLISSATSYILRDRDVDWRLEKSRKFTRIMTDKNKSGGLQDKMLKKICSLFQESTVPTFMEVENREILFITFSYNRTQLLMHRQHCFAEIFIIYEHTSVWGFIFPYSDYDTYRPKCSSATNWKRIFGENTFLVHPVGATLCEGAYYHCINELFRIVCSRMLLSSFFFFSSNSI